MKKYTFKKKTLITGALFGIFGLLGIMGLQPKQYENAKAVDLYSENVIYDDDATRITLSVNELNYQYVNLNNILLEGFTNEEYDGTIFSFLYNTTTYTLNDWGDDEFLDEYYAYCESEEINNHLIGFNSLYSEENYVYKFIYNDNQGVIAWEQNLTLIINEDFYEDIKHAIELDIQANQPISQGDSMIGAITSGLGLAPQVANEFVKGFSAIFWDATNQQLTRVSNFMLVMLGIAIVMGCIKLALYLLRNNTGA